MQALRVQPSNDPNLLAGLFLRSDSAGISGLEVLDVQIHAPESLHGSPGQYRKDRASHLPNDSSAVVDEDDGRPIVTAPKSGAQPVFKRLRNADDVRDCVNAPNQLQAYFIRQRNSYSALSITRALYQELTNKTHLSPEFLNYITFFGERESELEIAPPALKIRGFAQSVQDSSAYEFMYSIRFVDLNKRGDAALPTSRWSLRQSAVYSHGKSSVSKLHGYL